MKKNTYTIPLALVFCLFFLWAISSNLLPTMIRQLMKTCELNTFEASFTETAYWLAYFIFPIPIAMFMKRYSYKAGIIFGLILAAIGGLLFFPAAILKEYWAYLCIFFIIATGMSFYGEMPDMFNLILNSDHKLIKEVLNEEESACQAEVAPIQSEMDAVNKQRNELKDKQKGKKDEDIPTSEKDELNDLDKKWDDLKSKKEAIFVGYASNNKVIRQLIDLALLQNNMLKGEALNNFVKRSIELI